MRIPLLLLRGLSNRKKTTLIIWRNWPSTGDQVADPNRWLIDRDSRSRPRRRRVQEVGLGLALSKRLAEVLGGRVGLESELGQGSVFYATLLIHFTATDSSQTVSETARGARVKDV